MSRSRPRRSSRGRRPRAPYGAHADGARRRRRRRAPTSANDGGGVARPGSPVDDASSPARPGCLPSGSASAPRPPSLGGRVSSGRSWASRVATSSLHAADDATGENVQPQRLEVALHRDEHSGTLGIDLDEFAGQPTVAIVVRGGPAHRDGRVMPGDIILAVDRVHCHSVAQVISALASAQERVIFELLRQPLRYYIADELHVRVHREGASDAAGVITVSEPSAHRNGGGGGGGGDWRRCSCRLRSDRQLQFSELPGGLEGCIDLRSALAVQLVLLPPYQQSDQQSEEISLLHIKTAELSFELRGPNLRRWREPLAKMLMVSLDSRCQGWLYLLLPQDGLCHPRFLDLPAASSPLRLLVHPAESPQPPRALETLELSDVKSVRLLPGVPPSCRDRYAALAGASHTLQVGLNSEANLLFTSHEHDGLRRWAAALRRAHQHAVRAMARYSSMVLVEGWLEYQGQLEEWCRAFFVLTIGGGLQCFAREPDDVTEAEAIETIALEAIVRATRSKGMDFYDWCFDVETAGREYIRVRPGSELELQRWLSTINVYAAAARPSPPTKSEPAVRPPTPDAAPPAVDARGSATRRRRRRSCAPQSAAAAVPAKPPPLSDAQLRGKAANLSLRFDLAECRDDVSPHTTDALYGTAQGRKELKRRGTVTGLVRQRSFDRPTARRARGARGVPRGRRGGDDAADGRGAVGRAHRARRGAGGAALRAARQAEHAPLLLLRPREGRAPPLRLRHYRSHRRRAAKRAGGGARAGEEGRRGDAASAIVVLPEASEGGACGGHMILMFAISRRPLPLEAVSASPLPTQRGAPRGAVCRHRSSAAAAAAAAPHAAACSKAAAADAALPSWLALQRLQRLLSAFGRGRSRHCLLRHCQEPGPYPTASRPLKRFSPSRSIAASGSSPKSRSPSTPECPSSWRPRLSWPQHQSRKPGCASHA